MAGFYVDDSATPEQEPAPTAPEPVKPPSDVRPMRVPRGGGFYVEEPPALEQDEPVPAAFFEVVPHGSAARRRYRPDFPRVAFNRKHARRGAVDVRECPPGWRELTVTDDQGFIVSRTLVAPLGGAAPEPDPEPPAAPRASGRAGREEQRRVARGRSL